MMLDQFLPEYHFSEYHVVRVNAPPEIVFKTLKQVDMSGSRLIRPFSGVIRKTLLHLIRREAEGVNADAVAG
jgi:hypothetical protein